MAREITQPTYFRTGKNVSGSTIVKKKFVKRGAGQDEVVLGAAAADLIEGVTVEDIPNNGHRSIQTGGKALLLSGAAVALNALITCDAQGRGITAATGNLVKGQACSATSGADEEFEIELWTGRFVAP